MTSAASSSEIPISTHSTQFQDSSSHNLRNFEQTLDDSDSELEEITQEYLDSLLEKARINAAAQAQKQEEEIKLDNDIEDAELPALKPGEIPKTYIEFEGIKSAKISVRDPDVEMINQASSLLATPAPPIFMPKLTKQEKSQLRDKTAGPSWFDLPSPDPADLPRLHREVEALRLHNSLDPKRFYKRSEGEGKGLKGLPTHFAIGTVVLSSTPFGGPSNENLARAERKRTLVDELVDDSEAKSYAKRKFGELQKVRAAKGRGTLAKKKALRKQKW